MLNGIDFSYGGGVTTGQILAAGYHFVCRYLSGGNSKDISAAEVANYRKAGIPIVFVWETSGNMYTQANGVSAAQSAVAELARVGASGATVFFAQDVPVASGTNPVAYMRGVNSVIGVSRSGIYGQYSVVREVLNAGVAAYAWQTSGGSGGLWDNRARLRQVRYNLHVGPAAIDVDQAAFYNSSTVLTLAHDFGQFPRPSGSTPVTSAPALPVGTQKDWRHCTKCEGLYYGPNAAKSKCPADNGHHTAGGSWNYALPHVARTAKQTSKTQPGWNWCSKCQGLFFGPKQGASVCPASGRHTVGGSWNYQLSYGVQPSSSVQVHWRHCVQCQGLFYGPHTTDSNCPAGSVHSFGNSFDYGLSYTVV